MRHYKNFDEIDRDLKLLKLQMDIDKERIFLSYHHTKESLAPKAVVKSTFGSILKNTLILKGASKVLGFVGDKLK
ncbi:MAG TPA: DUF6327 family protein [Salinimicrobium sp.]|nr:DUF6327 family protein [Salinimicrobium sp.]